MDAFGYVSVVISVVIGLGLSHLLTGTAELVKSRRRVKFYWVHLLWVALIFVGHIFLWWSMWNLRLVRNWNFFSFLLILLAPVLLYVAAAFLIPKVEFGAAIDLREYFYQNHAAFFSVNAAFTALMSIENWVLSGRMSPRPVTIVFAFWFVLLCVSAAVKNARYHAAIALLFGLLFLVFIVMFGLRLGGP
jgi:cell division protein FtsW (lipid II flippase)